MDHGAARYGASRGAQFDARAKRSTIGRRRAALNNHLLLRGPLWFFVPSAVKAVLNHAAIGETNRTAAVRNVSNITSAIAAAISGATAFPICRNAGFIVPSKTKPSGNPCSRAASRTKI